MTAAMKHLFGFVLGAVWGWTENTLHLSGTDASILDLNATVRPGFAIVAMKADGPILGSPKACGFAAMGANLMAVDAVCARTMSLEPMKLGSLRDASRYLGNVAPAKIAQRGEEPRRVERPFEILDRRRWLRCEA